MTNKHGSALSGAAAAAANQRPDCRRLQEEALLSRPGRIGPPASFHLQSQVHAQNHPSVPSFPGLRGSRQNRRPPVVACSSSARFAVGCARYSSSVSRKCPKCMLPHPLLPSTPGAALFDAKSCVVD